MAFSAFNAKSAASNGSLVNRTVTPNFVPAKAPEEGVVQVILLQRKRTGEGGESDPRQRIPGSTQSSVRDQVVMDLVGVIVDGVCYPDYTGKTKLPKLNSPEYKELMARPCGLKVESLYAGGIELVRAALKDGARLPFTLEDLDDAEKNNTTNQLFSTAGAAFRALDLVEVQEWTIGDILFGSKSMSVNLMSEGNAFAESFTKLRNHFQFPNVAFVASIEPTLQATDLTVNGILTPTYSPRRVYFEWVEVVTGNRGQTSYELDPKMAISGQAFTVGTTTAKSAAELAQRSMSAGHRGSVGNTNYRSDQRDASKLGSLKRAFGGPINTNGAGVPTAEPSLDPSL